MKKQILFLTILTLNASCWAIDRESYNDSDAAMGKLIRLAMQQNPVETAAVLQKLTVIHSSEESELSDDALELGAQSAALIPVLAENQIRLTNDNISDDIDDLRVFYLSLDLSRIENFQSVIDSLNGRSLHNLRSIIFKKGIDKETSRFLAGLFDQTMKFPSLTTIILKESKIDDKDLYNIYEHFSRYNYLIRDLEQWSSRHDRIAAPITIKLDRETKKGLNSLHKWNGGIKSKKNISVHFRSSDESIRAPFVMSTR